MQPKLLQSTSTHSMQVFVQTRHKFLLFYYCNSLLRTFFMFNDLLVTLSLLYLIYIRY